MDHRLIAGVSKSEFLIGLVWFIEHRAIIDHFYRRPGVPTDCGVRFDTDDEHFEFVVRCGHPRAHHILRPVLRSVNRSLAIRPLPNRVHIPPAMAAGALALLAAVFVLVNPASAQRGGTTCSTAGAVSDAANNPGLVSDCNTLMAARDTLAGTATLNWSVSTPIDQWEGVTVSGLATAGY